MLYTYAAALPEHKNAMSVGYMVALEKCGVILWLRGVELVIAKRTYLQHTMTRTNRLCHQDIINSSAI